MDHSINSEVRQQVIPPRQLLAIGLDIAADGVVAADEAGDPGVGGGGERGEGRVAEEDRNYE